MDAAVSSLAESVDVFVDFEPLTELLEAVLFGQWVIMGIVVAGVVALVLAVRWR